MQMAKRTPVDEQYRLVIECRSSGLTDYQWCIEHGIKPGTFYNWVKRLKKNKNYDVPKATGRYTNKPAQSHDIVQLDVIPDASHEIEQNACVFEPYQKPEPGIIEIDIPQATIRFKGNINPMLFEKTLAAIGVCL